MKSPFAFPALLSLLPTLALLSACGQTGPLTMPKPPARAGAPAAPAAPAPGAPDRPVNTDSPPAPAAGTTIPAGPDINNTQGIQPPSPPNQR